MPLRLHLYNEWGFDQYTEFNIQIGSVNSHTPLGPMLSAILFMI